jgi:hypothetical protein
MKKTAIITIIILSCIQINAQTLTGLVYDKATKQPILGAHVYLDGTSIGNATDNSGKYTLQVNQIINTKLVARHIAYQTITIEDPFIHLPDTIYMEERMATLSEITVQADRFSRRQKMRAFREQFLGLTQAGRSCRIVNEDDIQLSFNMTTKTLRASSEQPIEVINTYLGYRILFDLVDFRAVYTGVTLNPTRCYNVYYAVMTSFTDLRQDIRRVKMRRDDIHEVSSRNFFKSLAYDPFFSADTTENPVFWVYEKGAGAQIDFNSYFTISDTLSQKVIQISDAMIEKENSDNSLLRINVSHRDRDYPDNKYRRYYSTISFFTNTLLVDQYGNINQFDKVFFGGQMGLTRAGDMLPLEYVP